MNRIAIAVVAAAFVAGCQDNETTSPKSSTDGSVKVEDKSAKADSVTAKSTSTGGTASTAAGPVEYQEVRVGSNVYVVGSKEAADKAKAGKLEKPVRGIGFGAPNEKVYFEEKNQAALEAEYQKRHPR